MHPSFTFSILLLSAVAALRADVVPAALFTDHAVLQRDKPIPVWGLASPREKVSVSFAGHAVGTTANAAGEWRVDLPAQSARSTPENLVIKGENTVTLTDIVVGEVWLASGQSNMEFLLKYDRDAAIEIPASAANPLIRHIKIVKTSATSPTATVKIERNTWQAAAPGTVEDFSAVGYYFAQDIHRVTGVPVGIIGSNWGGSPVEAWLPDAAFQTLPDLAVKARERWTTAMAEFHAKKAVFETERAAWRKERDAASTANQPFAKPEPVEPQGPGMRSQPTGLYNGMINPLAPYALRGGLWYQGESNAGRASEYRVLFPAMITAWRARFGQGDFPFYWVQLPNFGAGTPADTAWASLREAQAQALSLPNTGQAVAIDVGNVIDIHPRNKRDVGRRLARLALNRTYGVVTPDSGPVFLDARREGSAFRVSFKEVHGGLEAPLNTLSGFEVAGADRVFKSAEARIEKNTVLVSSAQVADPVAVRYAWRNAPVAGLFNTEGLPATPFRSDNW